MADNGDEFHPSDDAGVSRRTVLASVSLLPLAAMVPDALAAARRNSPASTYRFFSKHQAAVVDAATRRIAPGPDDELLELGHPGAHEADVVRYIDTMLSMFDHRTPKLFAGGPWSNRHTHGGDHMATFVPPDRAQAEAWRKRIKGLKRTYRRGIALLDEHAGGDFTKALALQQDLILASTSAKPFTAVLFQHTIEGMYSVPEYGGNKDLLGWKEIGFPGDSQPKGYTAAEMAEADFSLVDPTGIVQLLLDDFPKIAQALASGVWRA